MHMYRAIVHYHFKKGQEKEGMRFLEDELAKAAKAAGSGELEVWYSERESEHVIGMGIWNSLDDARRFQSTWESKEKELMKFCTEKPHREVYRVCDSFAKKYGKAA